MTRESPACKMSNRKLTISAIPCLCLYSEIAIRKHHASMSKFTVMPYAGEVELIVTYFSCSCLGAVKPLYFHMLGYRAYVILSFGLNDIMEFERKAYYSYF